MAIPRWNPLAPLLWRQPAERRSLRRWAVRCACPKQRVVPAATTSLTIAGTSRAPKAPNER